MIALDQIRISVFEKKPEQALIAAVAKRLHVKHEAIHAVYIKKKSIDARRRPEVFFLYTVWVETPEEKRLLRGTHGRYAIHTAEEEVYRIPKTSGRLSFRPVVVGFGPAGMFAAYLLALCHTRPIVIERGKEAAQRQKDVELFFKTGKLDGNSNVQFGEGGAGTFSDGKLNTQKNDKFGRNRFVLDTFHRFGANESILYDAKPHIGTDRLVHIVTNLRREILHLGGEIHFSTCLERLLTDNTGITGIRLTNGKTIETKAVILAIGHSARDTFEALYRQQIHMEAKPFAVGFRVEHPQIFIQENQYGKKAASLLPAAPYRLVAKGERDLYSFCMCPGGYVINASSENERLCVNGMSRSDRNSGNANSALVMPVGGDCFDLSFPLSGLYFARTLEEKAFSLGNGRIPQQLFGDYISNRISRGYGAFSSRVQGQVCLCNLRGLLPETLEKTFIEGVLKMDQKIKGFANEEIILSGIESRTSSPVRIPRNHRFMGSMPGLFPCGEGAGYAGGITSAAMDGLKTAEALLSYYDNY